MGKPFSFGIVQDSDGRYEAEDYWLFSSRIRPKRCALLVMAADVVETLLSDHTSLQWYCPVGDWSNERVV